MLARLDRTVGLETVIWAFPVAFLIHDGEEVLTAERFWREHRDRLPLPGGITRRGKITTAAIGVGVGYEFILVCLTSLLAARSRRPGRAMNLFTAALAVLFLNVFTHLGQTAWLRAYTPGVVTAPLVALPYTLYAFHRLFQAGLITPRSFARAMAAGALLGIPLVLSAHLVGLIVTRRR